MEKETKEIIVEKFSLKTYGILSGDIWYNLFSGLTEDQKTTITGMFKQIGKGDKIKLTLQGTDYVDFEMIEKGAVKQEHDMTNLRDLLEQAHENGLRSITTEMVEINVKEKYALFKARVVMAKKDNDISTYHTFESYGDALSYNVGNDGDATKKVKDSWIRMAESRAIVRALRWATNDARCAVEELPDDDVLPSSSEIHEEKQEALVQTNEEVEESARASIPEVTDAGDRR